MSPLIKTFLISMVPVVELRGAIPFAIASGVSAVPAACAAMLGNLLPVPLILLFIRSILAWMKARGGRLGDLALWVERHAAKRTPAVQKYAFWGLALFVGIPLPGTGAWTGSLIAAMLNLPFKRAFPAIVLGVLAAGIVVTLAASGVKLAFIGG